MTKLIALLTPLVLVLSFPWAPEAPAAEPAGPVPAEHARFRLEYPGYHHLVVHGKKRCPDARFDIELAGGRLEAIPLLPDGETLAATLRLPAGDTVLSVTPAAGPCAGLKLESVALR